MLLPPPSTLGPMAFAARPLSPGSATHCKRARCRPVAVPGVHPTGAFPLLLVCLCLAQAAVGGAIADKASAAEGTTEPGGTPQPAPHAPAPGGSIDPPPASPPTSSLKEPVLLLMTTTSRAGPATPDPGYLTTVLRALRRDLESTAQTKGLRPRDMGPRPWFSWLHTLVLNVHPHQHHPEFNRAKALFANDSFFSFNHSSLPIVDPWYGHVQEPDNLHNPEGVPGHEVRQQTCDLIASLLDAREFLLRNAPNAEEGRIVLVEDDSKPCEGMFAHLRFLLRELSTRCTVTRQWSLLTTSYGMNGVVLRMDLLDHFLQSLVREMHRYPPDWVILVPWWRPANEYADATAGSLAHAPSPQEVLPLDLRRILSLDLPPPPPLNPAAKYKHALFQHLGSLSSFEFRQHRAFQNRRVAGCYAVGQEFAKNKKRRVESFYPCEGD